MESPFSFEIETFDTFDRMNESLQTIENVLNNILKLMQTFEEFLKVLSLMPLSQKAGHSNQNVNKSNAATENVEIPTVSGLNDIAGLKHVKNVLNTLVILPRYQPQLFQNRTISNSILLYGPPGTGKTRLVHGLAAETGAVLHALSVGNLLSSYVGETERNIKKTFNQLWASEHFSILFIDEIDSICRKRTSSEHEYSRRIKTELMCELTKIVNCQNALIVAATNCPWDLDSAIIRRFQKRIYIPLPNSEERLELFQLLTKGTPIIQTPDQFLELIQVCEGFSGSDISSLIHDALDIPLTELQNTTIWNKTSDGLYEPYNLHNNPSETSMDDIHINELKSLPPFSVRARSVSVNDFLEAAKHIQITVTPEDLSKYEQFKSSK